VSRSSLGVPIPAPILDAFFALILPLPNPSKELFPLRIAQPSSERCYASSNSPHLHIFGVVTFLSTLVLLFQRIVSPVGERFCRPFFPYRLEVLSQLSLFRPDVLYHSVELITPSLRLIYESALDNAVLLSFPALADIPFLCQCSPLWACSQAPAITNFSLFCFPLSTEHFLRCVLYVT